MIPDRTLMFEICENLNTLVNQRGHVELTPMLDQAGRYTREALGPQFEYAVASRQGERGDRLHWEPGVLSARVLERVAVDALADLWRDCWRRGDSSQAFQRELFRERSMDILKAATGEPFEVIKAPRLPRPGGRAA